VFSWAGRGGGGGLLVSIFITVSPDKINTSTVYRGALAENSGRSHSFGILG
jgi:hypothetical protein